MYFRIRLGGIWVDYKAVCVMVPNLKSSLPSWYYWEAYSRASTSELQIWLRFQVSSVPGQFTWTLWLWWRVLLVSSCTFYLLIKQSLHGVLVFTAFWTWAILHLCALLCVDFSLRGSFTRGTEHLPCQHPSKVGDISSSPFYSWGVVAQKWPKVMQTICARTRNWTQISKITNQCLHNKTIPFLWQFQVAELLWQLPLLLQFWEKVHSDSIK